MSLWFCRGTPFGCEITPFIATDSSKYYSKSNAEDDAESILRCNNCAGYINSMCRMESSSWLCVICGEENKSTRVQQSRFNKGHRESSTSLAIKEAYFSIPHPTKSFLQSISKKVEAQEEFSTPNTPTPPNIATTDFLNETSIFNPTNIPPPPTSPTTTTPTNESSKYNNKSNSFKAAKPKPSAVPISSYSTYFTPAIKRPLVQVFLLPERMAPDILEGVVDCLLASIRVMHPDIQVILLSYSSVIGVYSLDSFTTNNENKSNDDTFDIPITFASYNDIDDSDDIPPWEEDEFNIPLDNMYVSIKDSNLIDSHLLDSAEHGHLNEVADFHQTARPLSQCRQVLYHALESFGSRAIRTSRSKNRSSNSLDNPTPRVSISEDALLNSDVERATISTIDWILHHRLGNDSSNDVRYHEEDMNAGSRGYEEDDGNTSNSNGIGANSGASEGRGLWGNLKTWLGWDGTSSAREGLKRGRGLVSGIAAVGGPGPIDDCSGVVLHVFVTEEVK